MNKQTTTIIIFALALIAVYLVYTYFIGDSKKQDNPGNPNPHDNSGSGNHTAPPKRKVIYILFPELEQFKDSQHTKYTLF